MELEQPMIRRFTKLPPSREVSRSILIGDGLAIGSPSRNDMLRGRKVDLTGTLQAILERMFGATFAEKAIRSWNGSWLVCMAY